MIRQISRLSPHQNGKVFGILMAVASLPLVALTALPMLLVMPEVDKAGNPVQFALPFAMFLLLPIFYLIFTYLFVALGCWLYNIFFKYIGGFEFEFKEYE